MSKIEVIKPNNALLTESEIVKYMLTKEFLELP